MVFVGKKIAFFFKPLVENAKRITVVCLVADTMSFFKWATKLEYSELFASKSTKLWKRFNVFYKIEKLHAKIYIFDHRIFLSSANLTYGSLFTNIEHAVEVTDREDKKKIRDYIERLRHD